MGLLFRADPAAAAGMSVEEIAAEIEAAGLPIPDPMVVAAFIVRCSEDPGYMPPASPEMVPPP